MSNFTFKAQADGAHLYFYGDIVGDSADKWAHEDVCPVDVRDALESAGDGPVTLHINSGGGDVFAAFAISNMLRAKKGKKTCMVDGVAASAASVIALVCDEVIMPENAMLMIHRASGAVWGNAGEMRDMADTLDKIDGQMLDVYENAAAEGVDREKLAQMVEAETWLTAGESAGIFRTVTQAQPLYAAAKVTLPGSAPESIRALMEKSEEEELLRMRLNLQEY